MKRLPEIVIIAMIAAFGTLLVVPAGMASQHATNDQSPLTLKQVRQRLKQNKQYLKEAKNRVKAGDTAGLDTALNNYDRSMQGLNTALSQGQIQGSPSQKKDAYNRVQTATSKHLQVLNGLLTKVPPQAVAHIQHAIDVSKMGQTTALNQLSQLHAQQGLEQGSNSGFGRSQGNGRPEGMGRSGGVGSFGAANPPMGGPMGGAIGHPAGGPPMGGGHGR
jgi:hypothetical protein